VGAVGAREARKRAAGEGWENVKGVRKGKRLVLGAAKEEGQEALVVLSLMLRYKIYKEVWCCCCGCWRRRATLGERGGSGGRCRL